MSVDSHQFDAERAYRAERLAKGWGVDGREPDFPSGRDPFDEGPWWDNPPGINRVTRPCEDLPEDDREAA